MTNETSVCFHSPCANCPIFSNNRREYATAAQLVDTTLDYARAIDGFPTVVELGGIVRKLSTEYHAFELQGKIAGAAVLAMAGDCSSRNEMNYFDKEKYNGKDF